MESSTAVSRYIPQNSKKREFLPESSSSGCSEVEVLEVTPPASSSSKLKSSKRKEVFPEINVIDIDMDEDGDEGMLNDPEVVTSAKGKEVMPSSCVGIGGVANDVSGIEFHDPLDADYGEEWMNIYDDALLPDDYDATLESQFDHMDIPAGVEISFPWLSAASLKNDSESPIGSSSSTQVTAKTQAGDINPSPPLNSLLLPDDDTQIGDMSTQFPHSYHHKRGKEPLVRSGKSKRTSRASHHHEKFPFHSSATGGSGSYLMPNMSTPKIYSSLSRSLAFPMDNLMGASQVEPSQPAKAEQRNFDEVLRSFENFKKFNTVEDYSDHQYAKNGSSVKQPPSSWSKRIQEEWKILEKDLPDEVFVRVYESRMDLLRAVIIGAEGTPYHDGLFFFDVFFPSNYPSVPPHVHYHSRGLRINPNLYCCGKVCLSLLNTWSGNQKEKWIPGVSTMLQVLVSIQGLILNAKPYFNEPGYEHMDNTVMGEKCSLEYSERTFIYNLQTMVYNLRRPPKNFEDFVVGHFCKRARGILVSCKAYLDGAQVGCLVKGGVQDVDEGDKSCSGEFKASLGVFMSTLVNQFIQTGAKDCEEFLYLSQLEKTPAAATAHTLPGRG